MLCVSSGLPILCAVIATARMVEQHGATCMRTFGALFHLRLSRFNLSLSMLEYMLNDHPLMALSDELWISLNYEVVFNPKVDECLFLSGVKLVLQVLFQSIPTRTSPS